jgi:hypothetical protein
MKKFIPIAVLIGICLLFFYKTIFFGLMPFPGDLLVSGYAPWNHESYGGYVSGAVPSKDQYFDVIRELYPWKTIVVSEVKKGTFPLWNPYNFSGAPLLANYQSQVIYPFTLLYFLMPQKAAWTIMVIIQPILGSIFLYLFATEIGLSSAAAIVAALLFDFSGFASVWMEFTTIWQTIMWLPLLLYLIERGVKQEHLSIRQQILFIVALYSAITAGHPQDFINSFLFLLIYCVFRMKSAKIFVPSLIFVIGIPFFIAAPQIFPTIELFRSSARVAHDYKGIIENMLIQWRQLPLIAVADYFGNPATKSNITGDYVGKTLSVGVAGFLLAILSLWQSKKSWHKTFFAVTGAVILLITVRSPLTELLYRYPWPVLSTGTPTRILFLLMLALSVLAGFGFDALKKSKHIPIPVIVGLWVLFAFLWIFSPIKRIMLLAAGILLAGSIIIVIANRNKPVLLLFIPLVASELLYGFVKFNPFVPVTFVYPENKLIKELQTLTGINRFWGYGTAAVEANFATQTGLYSPDGTDPLNLNWYNRFIQSSREGNIAVSFNRTTRSDATLAPGYGKEDLPANEFRLRVMDLLGVKYVLDRGENPKDENTFPTTRFKLIDKVDDWTIYENLKAAPRFFVTGDVRPYMDTKDFETQFFAPDFAPDKTVLLTQQDFNTIPKFTAGKHDIQLSNYKPASVTFKVISDSPAFLFLSDTYDNGWLASVNGKNTPVYKADFAFRGVAVPSGTSTVTFSYRPKSFTTGVWMSFISLIFAFLYFLYQQVSRSHKYP